jgi:hypothetical protein
MAYCVQSDLELVWGSNNISKWADANNNANAGEISARIAWAIEAADADINDRLRRTWHDLPFSTIPFRIKNLSARLAGIKLYKSPRGLTDGDETNEVMNNEMESCENELCNIIAGILKLDVEVTSSYHPSTEEVDITGLTDHT